MGNCCCCHQLGQIIRSLAVTQDSVKMCNWDQFLVSVSSQINFERFGHSGWLWVPSFVRHVLVKKLKSNIPPISSIIFDGGIDVTKYMNFLCCSLSWLQGDLHVAKGFEREVTSSSTMASGKELVIGKTTSFFYYFFPFIFISWRLITLQYCSGFCFLQGKGPGVALLCMYVLIPFQQKGFGCNAKLVWCCFQEPGYNCSWLQRVTSSSLVRASIFRGTQHASRSCSNDMQCGAWRGSLLHQKLVVAIMWFIDSKNHTR